MNTTKVEETKTPQATTEEKPFEIDFDRIKNGDEDYTREVNEHLAKEVASQEETPTPAPGTEAAQTATPPAAKPEEDYFNFDDGDPIYRGEPFKVKKADLKMLVQKGRHLEIKLSELSPYVNVVKNNPELAEAITRAAHDPEGAEQLRRIGEALKTGRITSQVEDDLTDLDLPGLNKDDVQAVAKIQKALQQREEKKRREMEETRLKEELSRRDYEATAMVTGLRAVEGEVFDKVRVAMQDRIKQLHDAVEQGVIGEDQFNQFVVGLTDPAAKDDHGKPLFVRFYNDVKAEVLGTTTPAQIATAVNKPAPSNNARLAPGTASPIAKSGDAGLDWQNMSQAEFDRRIAEKLASI